MTESDSHCGHDWPHKAHSWLPDYPEALWESCAGSLEPDADRMVTGSPERKAFQKWWTKHSKGIGYGGIAFPTAVAAFEAGMIHAEGAAHTKEAKQ